MSTKTIACRKLLTFCLLCLAACDRDPLPLHDASSDQPGSPHSEAGPPLPDAGPPPPAKETGVGPGCQATGFSRASTGAAEVHVVGIYEPGLPGHQARVTVARARPVILVLSSYEKTDWVVTAAAGTQIQRVVVSSYYPSTAKVPAGITVETAVLSLSPYAWPSSEAYLLIQKVEALAKLSVTSFRGCYTGDSFAISDPDSMPPLLDPTLPPDDPARREHAVWKVSTSLPGLTPAIILSADGLTAKHDDAVSPSPPGNLAVASVTQALGKWYWEVKVIKLGTAFSWDRRMGIAPSFFDPLSGPDTDLLVCSLGASGELGCGGGGLGTKYQPVKTGDVIGFALDLDKRELFVHQNGTWAGPNPATDKGRSIGASSLPMSTVPWVGLGPGDELRGNFGQAAFSHLVPAGFKPGWYLIKD